MRSGWPGSAFGPVGFDARNEFDKGKVQVVTHLHVPFALIDHFVCSAVGGGLDLFSVVSGESIMMMIIIAARHQFNGFD